MATKRAKELKGSQRRDRSSYVGGHSVSVGPNSRANAIERVREPAKKAKATKATRPKATPAKRKKTK